MPLIALFLAICFLLTTEDANANVNEEQQRFEVEVVGKGEPIILIPGFVSDQRVWEPIVRPLSASYQIHRISIAGFGNTGASNAPALIETRNALKEYIEENALNDVAVVGHSLGGFMGMWLATYIPETIGSVISVDGLPFIGATFTQSNDVTVASLAPQASYFRQFYGNLDSAGMRAATQQGVRLQATSNKHQQMIVAMAEISDAATAADAIYTLMSTDLRGELDKFKGQFTLLGASGGFSNLTSQQAAEVLYRSQMQTAPKFKVVMNTKSRHFIMYDDPNWLVEQIELALEDAKK